MLLLLSCISLLSVQPRVPERVDAELPPLVQTTRGLIQDDARLAVDFAGLFSSESLSLDGELQPDPALEPVAELTGLVDEELERAATPALLDREGGSPLPARPAIGQGSP